MKVLVSHSADRKKDYFQLLPVGRQLKHQPFDQHITSLYIENIIVIVFLS